MGAEREYVVDGGVTAAAVLAVPSGALDLRVDGHVHTGFAAGRDSVGVVVMAADRAGLTGVTFADQAGPDTKWLSAYADAVRRAQQRTELTLRVAAEVEVVQQDGWLAMPSDLGDLEALSVAVSRLPMSDGSYGPREIRAMLAGGVLDATRLAELVVRTTVCGIERASRYAPTQLARPLSLLTRSGVDAELPDALAAELARACVATGTVVEISEAWRSPSARLVAVLQAAGVSMVAASDARYADEVGRWQYLHRL